MVRVRPSYQVAQSDCGLACVHMLIQSFGISASLRKMRVTYAPGRDGLSLRALTQILSDFGLNSKVVKCSYSNLSRVPLPAIIAWEPAHYVVLEKRLGDSWRIVDPSSGRRWCSKKEIEANFRSFCVTAARGNTKVSEGQVSDDPSWKSLAVLLAGKAFLLLPILLGVILVTGVTVAVPQITGWLVKQLGGMDQASIIAVIVSLAFGFILVHLLNTAISSVASTTISKRLTEIIYYTLLRAPLSYFNIRPRGELLYRVSLIKKLESFVSGVLPKLFVGSVAGIGCLIYICVLDFRSFLLLLAATLIYLGAFNFSQRQIRKLSDEQNREDSLANSVLVDSISSFQEVKAGGHEEKIFESWAAHNAKVVSLERKKLFLRGSISSLVNAIQTFLPVVIFLTNLFSSFGPDALGQAVQLQLLATVFLAQVTMIVEMGAEIGETSSALRRVDDLVNYMDAPMFSPDASSQFQLPVRLESVSFRYGAFAKDSVSDISIEIGEQRRIAVVGKTGCGKSTLAKLIGGLLLPTSGSIEANGVRLRSVSQSSFYDCVAYVPQDSSLRNATLRDNLSWGNEHTDADLVRCLELAQFRLDPNLFPQGLQTMLINGGQNISGGQRQRICIARALLKEPRLLILDEATSGLDQRTEASLYESLSRLGCAFVTITHRLETIRDFDEIVVLDQGIVVEKGSFESLLEGGGLFSKMYFAYQESTKDGL